VEFSWGYQNLPPQTLAHLGLIAAASDLLTQSCAARRQIDGDWQAANLPK